MLRTTLTIAWLLLLVLPAQASRFDLKRWLDEPDVKLVAVEVYSDYCEPCKEAAPRWEALRKRYKDEGLKLVVINVDDYDSDRQCKTLAWRPDLLICSPEAGEALGVCEGGRCSVPQAFLWSWQGNLLVRGQSHVDAVENAVREYLADHPRVLIDAKNAKGKADRALSAQVASALGRIGKLTVVADKEMKRRLNEVAKESHRPGARDDQRCQIGAEVSANSLLSVERFSAGVLSMILSDAASGCQRAAASVNVDKRGLAKAVDRGLYQLMSQLKRREIAMPKRLQQSRRDPGKVEVRELGSEREAWEPQDEALVAISFQSNPPGAEVILEGKRLCATTPCRREVPFGTHQVEMALDKHQPVTRRVAFEAGRDVRFTLEPAFGTLSIRSRPSGVSVKIGTETLGKTPLEGVKLEEGRHEIALGDRCYETERREVSLPKGASHALDIALTARVAGLRVTAHDEQGDVIDAKVKVDGVVVGDSGSILKVPLCASRIEVSRPGHAPWTAALSLRERETKKLKVRLSRSGAARVGAGVTEVVHRFVRIEAGSFMMGSPSSEWGRLLTEGPPREVTITRPFIMQMTEVTQAQWRQLMGNSPAEHHACGDQCPVEKVNWWDALAYANALSRREGLPECYTLSGCWGEPGDGVYGCFSAKVNAPGGNPAGCAGYRLPTEAEWEYAARAGGSGPMTDNLASKAWYSANASGTTHPVGTKLANTWGLHDMQGNVWEWVWDWHGSYAGQPSRDPYGPALGAGRGFRGCGSEWASFVGVCRVAFRHAFVPLHRGSTLGFRLVKSEARPAQRVQTKGPEQGSSGGTLSKGNILEQLGARGVGCEGELPHGVSLGELLGGAGGPSANPTIRFDEPRVRGPLKKGRVKRSVKKHKKRFRACYDEALRGKPGLSGEVIFQMAITSSGELKEPRLVSGLNHPEMESCLVDILFDLRFPKFKGKRVEVSYPIFFSAN